MSKENTTHALRARMVKEHEEEISYLDEHRTLFEAVAAACPEKVVNSISCSWYSFNLSATGDKHALAACVRALRLQGFRTTVHPEKGETAYSATFYHHSLPSARISLHFSSTSCRRVKVGTKMVEQDIYETVCGETEISQSA